MIQFFGLPISTLTLVLAITSAVIIGAVLLLAVGNIVFFKIGVRNITRRRTQMFLIVFALMLSTTLLSSVLATGDVMTSAVQSVAVYNWGNIDEIVEGGHGALGTFSQHVYTEVLQRARSQSNVEEVGAALRESNLLVADRTSRQVRSGVMALGVLPGSETNFGGLIDATTKVERPIRALSGNAVYLNQTSAQLLAARPGDTLFLYSQRWTGRRYTMRVAGVVQNTSIVGDSPTLLGQLSTFQTIEHMPDRINQVFIANRSANGVGGVSGVALSQQVTDEITPILPHSVHVSQVKAQGVKDSQNAEDIFSRIFSLFALFALAIGLLLIFLIFVLLAAERRTEMGMARAIGVQRSHLVLMYMFEGTVYDLLASFMGILTGVGLGAALVYFLSPVLVRFNFPLRLTFQPSSLLLAYCLGVIFTFCSISLAALTISRMTIVDAIRDLPESGRGQRSLRYWREDVQRFRQQWAEGWSDKGKPRGSGPPEQQHDWRRLRRLSWNTLPVLLSDFVSLLTVWGIVPLCLGLWLLGIGLASAEVILFSLGLSLIIFGAALLLKTLCVQALVAWMRLKGIEWDSRLGGWSGVVDGAFAALVGLMLMAYWALPFDALVVLGLPRFQGGIEVFFVAGVMMVLGTTWALIANSELLMAPILAFCSHLPHFYAVLRLAVAYPLQRRLRTGLSMVMFSLVVFAMTVMAIITNAMQNSYVDINTQTGGYDIQATAYFKGLPDQSSSAFDSSLVSHGIQPQDFAAIGERTTTAVGVLQLGAAAPRWSLYPAQIVSGGFLQGYGLHLTARAEGLNSDSAVFQALRTHPDYALIDSSALPDNPNSLSRLANPTATSTGAGASSTPPGFDADSTFKMSGVYQGESSFPAVPVWTVGVKGLSATKVTVIGVVDNSDGAHYGLYISRAFYDPQQAITLGNANNSGGAGGSPRQSYYFKVVPGQDAHALALSLGSAYLDNGLETTVLADLIWQVRGPRILLSDILLGVVGLTLLLGVAALALTGTRAVIERRQQIGMLRAMGSSRHLIQGAFLLESFFVGTWGSVMGIVLGVILARNIFAANFFEQYQTGLTFHIPWQELGIIIIVSLLASLLGALLPAWQAGRVAPAEALRYV
ncbi:ABC transporter permease [Ktedonobacteria bacterium brp13]|nr:ABC transporter permease [Ktedonobacteria bacterium brp13]